MEAQTSSTSVEPNMRSVYVITYSKADLSKIPTRETFCNIVKEAFLSYGDATIVKYACSKEAHQDGSMHYHMVIKLSKQKKVENGTQISTR